MAQPHNSDIDQFGESAQNGVKQASTRAHRTVEDAASRAHHIVDEAAGAATRTVERVVNTTTRIGNAPHQLTQTMADTIRERPLRNIGLALLLGFVVGRLTGD